jgi:AraC-like DNA-binding protein
MKMEREVAGSLQLFSYRLTTGGSGIFEIHCHSYYEIYYFLRGKVEYLVEGVAYAPAPDSVLLIPAGVLHGVKADPNLPYERFALHFLPELLSPETRKLLLSPFQHGGAYLINPDPNLLACCRSLLDCGSLSPALQTAALRCRTEALLTMLCAASQRQGKLPKEDTPSTQTEEILSYLNSHLGEDLSLDLLCQKFFISKNHLNLLFRKATGTTVWDYLSRKRAALAQQLILSGTTAMQAARQAGFQDYSAFYRCYRKIFGQSPAQAKGKGLFMPKKAKKENRL